MGLRSDTLRAAASAYVSQMLREMPISLPIFPLIVAALLAPTILRAAEGEWSRFRGPNGSGISGATSVPTRWTAKDYNWKVKLPGDGHSSPIVWERRIFVTCGDPAIGKRMILCLDAATGRTLWQRDYESKTFGQHGDNSYATATPAADAAGIVVTWTTPDEVVLLALDHDGHERWRRELGKFVCIHGSGASPIIVDDLVVLDNDQEDPKALPPGVYAMPGAPRTAGKSFLIGLDRKTGQTRWQLDRVTTQAAFVTPCLHQGPGGRPEIILASTYHGVTGVDAATGKINWELNKVLREHVDATSGSINRESEPLFCERCVSSPIVADGLVFASHGRGATGLKTVAVRPGSREKNIPPSLAYEITKPTPLVPTPLAKDGRLYLWADNGRVTCARVASGKILWREKVEGSFYSSPVCVNDRLYCVAKNGDIFVLAAADTFELLARLPLGEPSYATPAVAGGVMYLRTVSQLFSLGGPGKK